jgi:phenylacetate-CoA ligase
MNERIFQEKYLDKVKRVLDFAINNPYSNFYKKKYEKLDFNPLRIRSYEDFKKIPYLTKEEIINTPIEDRIFVNEKEIEHFSFSSGTTNNNIPLILPQSSFNHKLIRKYVINEDELAEMGISRLLVLLPPLSPPFIKILALADSEIIPIPGDIKNLKVTALITKQLSIKSIITTPTILEYFSEHLEEISFDKNSIKFISLAGELCSRKRLENIKKGFPNAKIVFRYGKSESGGPIGYRCKHLENLSPSLYHPLDLYLFEINKDSTSKDGAGEIIHTDIIEPKGFPLIRYLTNDIGSIKKENCECGSMYTIKLGGRNNYDFLKLNGVILTTEIIEYAIKNISDIIEPQFQMHIYEKEKNGKTIPSLLLKVVIRKTVKADQVLKNKIASLVSKELYLAPGKSLEYFAKDNIFSPLEIEFVDKWPTDQIKSKNIISHIE